MVQGLQRQRTRFPLSLPVRIWPRGGRRKESKPGKRSAENTFTENISSDGCFFPLSQKLPVGSQLDIEIDIPLTSKPRQVKLRCTGRIVRIERGEPSGKVGVGCRIERYKMLAQLKRR
jgi:hypothetical protein